MTSNTANNMSKKSIIELPLKVEKTKQWCSEAKNNSEGILQVANYNDKRHEHSEQQEGELHELKNTSKARKNAEGYKATEEQ